MIRYYSIKIGIFRHSEREFIYHIFLFGQFHKIKKKINMYQDQTKIFLHNTHAAKY